MKAFKFLKGPVTNYFVEHADFVMEVPMNRARLRRWIGGAEPGNIHWMNDPRGVLFYMEPMEELNAPIPTLTMEMRSVTIDSQMRHITSVDEFLAENHDKMIWAYQFIDYINGGVRWNSYSFHNIPRDRPMIFAGIIQDVNVNLF